MFHPSLTFNPDGVNNPRPPDFREEALASIGNGLDDHAFGIIVLRLLDIEELVSTRNSEVLLVEEIIRSGPDISFEWRITKGRPADFTQYLWPNKLQLAAWAVSRLTGISLTYADIIASDQYGSRVLVSVWEQFERNPATGRTKDALYWHAVVWQVDGLTRDHIRLQREKVRSARWLSWEDAIDLATLEETREVLRATSAFLAYPNSEIKLRCAAGPMSFPFPEPAPVSPADVEDGEVGACVGRSPSEFL